MKHTYVGSEGFGRAKLAQLEAGFDGAEVHGVLCVVCVGREKEKMSVRMHPFRYPTPASHRPSLSLPTYAVNQPTN